VWEQLRPADIERARQRLAKKRTEVRRRYEEELNRLDIDQAEVEQFARLVAAFAEKHLLRSASTSSPTVPEENTTQPVESSETSTAAAPQENDVLPSNVEHHQRSSNFGAPFPTISRG